jgi:hypothetical protein
MRIYDGIAYYNCTSHELRLMDAKPRSVHNERDLRIDLVLPVDVMLLTTFFNKYIRMNNGLGLDIVKSTPIATEKSIRILYRIIHEPVNAKFKIIFVSGNYLDGLINYNNANPDNAIKTITNDYAIVSPQLVAFREVIRGRNENKIACLKHFRTR